MFYFHLQDGTTVGTVALLASTCVIGGLDCFLSRVSILTRDTDIANVSVRSSVCPSVRPSVTFRYQMKTALTCDHSFFTVQ